MHLYAWLSGIVFFVVFVFFVEMGFHHVGQPGPKFLTSNDPPTLASQSTYIFIKYISAYSHNKFFNKSYCVSSL